MNALRDVVFTVLSSQQIKISSFFSDQLDLTVTQVLHTIIKTPVHHQRLHLRLIITLLPRHHHHRRHLRSIICIIHHPRVPRRVDDLLPHHRRRRCQGRKGSSAAIRVERNTNNDSSNICSIKSHINSNINSNGYHIKNNHIGVNGKIES